MCSFSIARLWLLLGAAGFVYCAPLSNTTIQPVLIDNSTVVSTTSTSSTTTTTVINDICRNSRCQATRYCVVDPEFAAGYRCCKKRICAKNEGRYCPEPGDIANTTRLPAIREKRFPFKPNEIVIYKCVPSYHYVMGSPTDIKCLSNGSWPFTRPRCVKYTLPAHEVPNIKHHEIKKPNDDPPSPPNNTVVIIIAVLCCLLLIFIAAWF
uniref:Sushi domain-containing protein n=1 Tax=Ciona savignyi TaxID=51511 RepID=H2ZLA2_CIOSA